MSEPVVIRDEIVPELMQRIATGDIRAFERLYDAFSGILYSIALRMLVVPEDAEELLQEIFTKIWRDAGSYDPSRGAPLAWAITMTRHRAIDKIRSNSRRVKLREDATTEAECDPPTQGQNPGVDAEHSEDVRVVQDSLASLSIEERDTINLAYFGGLSQSEIAKKLSVPLSTVKSRIRTAMARLRTALKGYQ